MKVSANLTWNFLETLPVSMASDRGAKAAIEQLAIDLNCLGVEFKSHKNVIDSGQERLATRLALESLIAQMFGLSSTDFMHISTRFPIYDKDVDEEFRYAALAVDVYRTMLDEGLDAGERRAAELAKKRGEAGWGFDSDEIYIPEGGWERANEEARAILEEG